MKSNSDKIAWAVILVCLVAKYQGVGVVAPATPARAVIFRESLDTDKNWGALWVDLRNGEAGKFFSSDGRRLSILDKDDTNSPEVKDIEGAGLPVLLLYSANGKLIKRQSLKPGVSASEIVAIAKGAGG